MNWIFRYNLNLKSFHRLRYHLPHVSSKSSVVGPSVALFFIWISGLAMQTTYQGHFECWFGNSYSDKDVLLVRSQNRFRLIQKKRIKLKTGHS